MPSNDERTIDMEVGASYTFNVYGASNKSGLFEGWTSFGWMAFTTEVGDDVSTMFYNPAHLMQIRPERFDSEVAL